MSVGHDLQMLAEEVDTVVGFNGGNAYVLHNWQWITVDSWGSTAHLMRIAVLDCPVPIEFSCLPDIGNGLGR